jgi:hypothetical protein
MALSRSGGSSPSALDMFIFKVLHTLLLNGFYLLKFGLVLLFKGIERRIWLLLFRPLSSRRCVLNLYFSTPFFPPSRGLGDT